MSGFLCEVFSFNFGLCGVLVEKRHVNVHCNDSALKYSVEQNGTAQNVTLCSVFVARRYMKQLALDSGNEGQ